jgi:hypothetical protein
MYKYINCIHLKKNSIYCIHICIYICIYIYIYIHIYIHIMYIYIYINYLRLKEDVQFHLPHRAGCYTNIFIYAYIDIYIYIYIYICIYIYKTFSCHKHTNMYKLPPFKGGCSIPSTAQGGLLHKHIQIRIHIHIYLYMHLHMQNISHVISVQICINYLHLRGGVQFHLPHRAGCCTYLPATPPTYME